VLVALALAATVSPRTGSTGEATAAMANARIERAANILNGCIRIGLLTDLGSGRVRFRWAGNDGVRVNPKGLLGLYIYAVVRLRTSNTRADVIERLE
jgi:hypothetical protein